jgi:predicted DNA-binding protein (UPF0251 family)
MARPICRRRVSHVPEVSHFKPAGVGLRSLEEVTLTLDELEALRLADLNSLYQEESAKSMGISRPTFSRVIEQARRKVADALVNGKALRIEGGVVSTKGDEGMRRRRRGSGRSRDPQEVENVGLGRGPCGRGQRRRYGQCRDSVVGSERVRRAEPEVRSPEVVDQRKK